MDIKSFLVFCILSEMYCKELFVKKYTTVDISCPFIPTSWYYDQSMIIAYGRDVNPSLTSKYDLSDILDLTIFNFTDTDQGRYMCQVIIAEEFKQHAVMVNLCNVPDELNYVTYEPKENFSETQGKLLCKDGTKTQNKDQIYHKAIISILKLPTLQQNIDERDENTLTGTIMEYKWILSNETTKEIAINDTQLYVYTCERNDSNTTEELPSNDTLHIYYSNKTVYLRDPENYATGFVQVYKLIGISLVCGLILVCVLIWGIRRAWNKIKNNADNIARLDESQNCPAEGYSSIDRRHRIEVGQMVSYKASRVSRCSIANESGHGLVYMPTVSSDGRKGRQPEETNGDDNLTVPYLKNITSKQNNKETPFLNYIEVEFNTDTVSPKFHIHGSGNETPYADIDITLKADPLPESDSSEEEDPDTNSDLLKLDDIIKIDKPD